MNHLIKALKTGRTLMLEPIKAKAYIESTKDVSFNLDSKASDVRQMLELMFGKPREMEIHGETAIIPIQGVIGKGLSDLEKLCGAVDVDDISEYVAKAESDPAIKQVIFDINSPGGTTAGVPELANQIFKMTKPTMSYTDSEACSAAYFIGSQAKRFCASHSADIGAIGVYIAFADFSEAYAAEGIKMEVIKSGEYKAMGMEGTTLSDKQRQLLQDDVNETHAEFKSAVKRVRLYAQDEDMEGQVFSGKKAAARGLVTGLYGSMDEAVEAV
jgi:signal peptide peptidase SppA